MTVNSIYSLSSQLKILTYKRSGLKIVKFQYITGFNSARDVDYSYENFIIIDVCFIFLRR